MQSSELVNIDGWLTDNPAEFHSYVSRRVNGWSFAEQLAVDARSWKPWAFWLVSAFTIWQPLSEPGGWSVQFAFLGVFIAGSYFRIVFKVVGGMRRMRLLEATIRFDGRHPLDRGLVTGAFVELGGSTSGRAMLPEWAAEKTSRPDGMHQVLVAFDPQAELNWIVGVRPHESATPIEVPKQ